MTIGRDGNAVRNGQVAPPCAMVIFGAAGDLTKRKLIPALYNVAKGNLLSREFGVIGVARADLNDESFRARLRDAEWWAIHLINSPGSYGVDGS